MSSLAQVNPFFGPTIDSLIIRMLQREWQVMILNKLIFKASESCMNSRIHEKFFLNGFI